MEQNNILNVQQKEERGKLGIGLPHSREFNNLKEIHRRITLSARSNSFSKDNQKSQPRPQKKGRPPLLIQATRIEILCIIKMIVFVLTSELLAPLLCSNEFSSHNIVLHTKRDVKVFPVPLVLTNWLLEQYTNI